MANFKIGDMVTWRSQSQGSWKQKSGEIVAVVPARNQLRRIVEKMAHKERYNLSAIDLLGIRDHESYIIAADRARSAKIKLYWPKVAGLEVD